MNGFRALLATGGMASAASLMTFIALALGATSATAAGDICTGTEQAPGVLAGTYTSSVLIEGVCVLDGGPALVEGNLTLARGAGLVAAYAKDDRTGSGSSSLTVQGDLDVGPGAALVLGCEAKHFACRDGQALSSADRIEGSLNANKALGVVVHNSVIEGAVKQAGGGGGQKCEVTGAAFHIVESVAYSDYEDSSVRSMRVKGLSSCWLGVARVTVTGSMDMLADRLSDPDAIEILSNKIGAKLVCHGDSRVWDSKEEAENQYPREPEPNTVHGKRVGQCVHESPPEEGGPPGAGPF